MSCETSRKESASSNWLTCSIELNEIANNYVADMAKYAPPTEAVKIRACFDSIPAQLAKENKKFQYKVAQKGGSAALFGVSIDWLTQAGVVLCYWAGEYTAELDFVLQKGGDIIGVEVKKGIKTRSKSLNVFSRKYSPAYSIRFSEKNFGKDGNILATPHYAAFCV